MAVRPAAPSAMSTASAISMAHPGQHWLAGSSSRSLRLQRFEKHGLAIKAEISMEDEPEEQQIPYVVSLSP